VEQSTRRTRQAVPKCPRASASKDEPSQKKARKGSEAAALAQVPEIIPSGVEEQEEEEEEAVSNLHPWGLRSRDPAVLTKVEPAGQSVVAEGSILAEPPAAEMTERAELKYQLNRESQLSWKSPWLEKKGWRCKNQALLAS